MKLQRQTYSCGVFAIINAARGLSVKLTEKKVKVHTGTTREHGTGSGGILQALERLGFSSEEINEEDYDKAYKKLSDAVLNDGSTAIVLTQKGEHWIAVIGHSGDSLLLFDSQRTKANKEESGVHVWSAALVKRYWSAYNGKHYGIIVSRA